MTLFEQMLEEQILMAKEKYDAKQKEELKYNLKEVVKAFSCPTNKSSVSFVLVDIQANKARYGLRVKNKD